MSKYWGIPLIGRILKALNVSTPEQLSALSISQLASVKGVGPAKIRAILDLVKNVQKSTTKREAAPVLLSPGALIWRSTQILMPSPTSAWSRFESAA